MGTRPLVLLIFSAFLSATSLADEEDNRQHIGKTVSEWIQSAESNEFLSGRIRAIKILGQIGPEAKKAIPSLTKLLKDEDKTVRSAAAISLGEIGGGDKEVVVILAELLADKDVGPAATVALSYVDSRQAIPLLIDSLENERCRERAAAALANYGENAAAASPALIKHFKTMTSAARYSITHALFAVDFNSAVSTLSFMLYDNDAETRLKALDSLAYVWRFLDRGLPLSVADSKTGAEMAVCIAESCMPPLILAKDDHDNRVSKAAQIEINALTSTLRALAAQAKRSHVSNTDLLTRLDNLLQP